MTSLLKIFCDFDGTISLNDDCDRIVDHCMGRAARQAIDAQIVSGKISFRAGYAEQFAGITLTWEEAAQFINPQTGLDYAFEPFARWAEGAQIPVTILSAGVESFIRIYLAAIQLDHLDVRANRVQVKDRRWRVLFRDESPSGHDKAAALIEAKSQGYRTVFIGDGISDIPAASVADILFAKTGRALAEHCIQSGIVYQPFHNFSDVLNYFLKNHPH